MDREGSTLQESLLRRRASWIRSFISRRQSSFIPLEKRKVSLRRWSSTCTRLWSMWGFPGTSWVRRSSPLALLAPSTQWTLTIPFIRCLRTRFCLRTFSNARQLFRGKTSSRSTIRRVFAFMLVACPFFATTQRRISRVILSSQRKLALLRMISTKSNTTWTRMLNSLR